MAAEAGGATTMSLATVNALRRYRMLIAFGLASVVMIFVSFTTAFVVRKAGAVWDPARNDYVSNWVPTTLPVRILLLNTLVLLLSSLTLEMARRRAAEDVALSPIADIPGIRVSDNRSLPWVWATIVLGLMFLGGQYAAWHQLRLGHIDIEPNVSTSFFFMLTGVHAVHLLGGILALLYAGMTWWLHRPIETQADRDRRYSLVLALHGSAVDLRVRAALFRAVAAVPVPLW